MGHSSSKVSSASSSGVSSGASSQGNIEHFSKKTKPTNANYTKMMKTIHDNLIGEGVCFDGPFGERRVLYLDYTASGRSVRFIEEFILREVCQKYANTHTSTCITARQTSTYREWARDYIKECVGANDDDVLLFTGSGVTGAIHKLVSALQIKPTETVVMVGPYEHHSNILPWKESGATVLTVAQASTGLMDLQDLEEKLQSNSTAQQLICSFSAASNVTGIVSEVRKVTRLVKKYGGLVFWDYATAGPYLEINMNPNQQGCIDAVFISPHKFIGGPQTPGILVAKKNLFKNEVPVVPGGGTVAYVYSGGHEYLADIEAREEGGTPAIIESIRAGLAFKLKHAVGFRHLESREEYLYRRAKDYWTQNCPHMIILGSGSVYRLPIFSFIVTHSSLPKLVHHNFISTLLNDLYGIQTRGGCACAGPYGELLLGIEAEQFLKYFRNQDDSNENSCACDAEKCDHSNRELLKPGFCRLNLPYTITEAEIDFVLKAVQEVTTHGWKLLPLYTYDVSHGSWQYRKRSKEGLSFLDDLEITPEGINLNEVPVKQLDERYFESTQSDVRHLLASDTFDLLEDDDSDYQSDSGELLPSEAWFLTPEEAEDLLEGRNFISKKHFIKRRSSKEESVLSQQITINLPFNPRAMTARQKGRKKRNRINISDSDMVY